jgi:hypothetical protein
MDVAFSKVEGWLLMADIIAEGRGVGKGDKETGDRRQETGDKETRDSC